jgi:cytochrome c
MRRTVLACGVVVALATSAAAQDAESVKRGQELLTTHCSRCHAVGRTDKSRDPEAPPFRILSHRYPIESLEEALGEGLVSGHPEMPEFTFEGPDVGAIIAYLKSIQER